MISIKIRVLEVSDCFPDNLGHPIKEKKPDYNLADNTAKRIEIAVKIGGLAGLSRHIETLFSGVFRKKHMIKYLLFFIVALAITSISIYHNKFEILEAALTGCLKLKCDNCSGRAVWSLIFLSILLLAITYFLFIRRNLLVIWLYVLDRGEPFPVIHPRRHGKHKYVMAVRMLEPNVRMRINRYLESAEDYELTRWMPLDLSRIDPDDSVSIKNLFNSPSLDSSLINLSRDIWPLVRVAIDRLLYLPRWKDFEKIGIRADPEKDPPLRSPRNQIYFAYKMHAPQLATFFLLVVITLLLSATIAEPGKTQYPIFLGGLSVIWGIFACWLHRRQREVLVQWSGQWHQSPFGHCPVYFYCRDAENPLDARWEELTNNDFRARIEEFGLDSNKLFEWGCTLLVIGFLQFLGAINCTVL